MDLLGKLVNTQTLIAAVFAFTVGWGTQVYAVASWKTSIDTKLENAEQIIDELHKNSLADHDRLIIVQVQTNNILDRLDRMATALNNLRDSLMKDKK